MTRNYGHWINGESVPSSSGDTLNSCRPGGEDIVATIARGNADDVDAAVQAARSAQAEWRDQKPIERGRLLMALANELKAQSAELGSVENDESGKAAFMGPMEVAASGDYFEFYAGLVNLYVGEVIDAGPGFHSYTVREPYGVVGIITPWNAPLNQAARAAAPALAAGNTIVLKPSEETSATTLEMARVAKEVGIPDGVINVVTGIGAEAGQPLVEHPLVRKIAFTGSLRAGKEIGKVAADRVLPVTLELGGKSANIVFEDADISAAARGSLQAFAFNTGQVCSAGTRLYAHESIHDELVVAMVAASGKVGRFLGQLTTSAQADKVREYFEIAAAEGAKLEVGGSMGEDGWSPELTIYTGVTNEMRIAREEIFGPVLSVISFVDEAEAIELANDSDYGLAAGLWTTDVSRAHRVAGRLEAGQVFINSWGSGIETPFGGYKQSGIGREKGVEALHHYSQLKSISLKL